MQQTHSLWSSAPNAVETWHGMAWHRVLTQNASLSTITSCSASGAQNPLPSLVILAVNSLRCSSLVCHMAMGVFDGSLKGSQGISLISSRSRSVNTSRQLHQQCFTVKTIVFGFACSMLLQQHVGLGPETSRHAAHTWLMPYSNSAFTHDYSFLNLCIQPKPLGAHSLQSTVVAIA